MPTLASSLSQTRRDDCVKSHNHMVVARAGKFIADWECSQSFFPHRQGSEAPLLAD